MGLKLVSVTIDARLIFWTLPWGHGTDSTPSGQIHNPAYTDFYWQKGAGL